MIKLLTRLKPFAEESIKSYCYRLAEKNCISHNLLFKNAQNISNINFEERPEFLNELCGLSGFTKETLRELSLLKYYNSLCINDCLDRKEKIRFFEPFNVRFCPECYKEIGYHKIQWQFVPLNICTKHGIYLINKCSKCGSNISYSSFFNGQCYKCEQILTEIVPAKVNDYNILVLNQLIENKLNIDRKEVLLNQLPNAVLTLPTPHFFNFLSLFTEIVIRYPTDSFGLKNIKVKNYVFKNINTLSLGQFYLHALNILKDWPGNFYKYLDEFKIKYKENYEDVLTTHFRKILIPFKTRLNNIVYIFFWQEFVMYLYEHPYGYSFQSIKVLINSLEKEMSQILLEKIDLKLTANRYEYHQSEVVRKLKIKWDTVSELINFGLLEFENKKTKYNIISAISFKNFVKSFYEEHKESKFNIKSEKLISIGEAVPRLSNFGTSFAELLLLAKDGQIEFEKTTPKQGLRGIMFYKKEIQNLFNHKQNGLHKTIGRSLREAHQLLNIKQKKLLKWIDAGLINTMEIVINGKKVIRISDEEIDRFKNSYIDCLAAEEEFGWSRASFSNWAKEGVLESVSGPGIDAYNSYLLKREEIKYFLKVREVSVLGISLSKVLLLFKVSKRTILSWIDLGLIKTVRCEVNGKKVIRIEEKEIEQFKKIYINCKSAEKEFGYPRNILRKWTKDRLIKHYSGPGIDTYQKYLFKRDELIKFIEQQTAKTEITTTLREVAVDCR